MNNKIIWNLYYIVEDTINVTLMELCYNLKIDSNFFITTIFEKYYKIKYS